jgi:4-amino-4-deoxy-L-arabinose transferase-like glycosyltransferase
MKKDFIKKLEFNFDRKYVNIIIIISLLIFSSFIFFYNLGSSWSLLPYDEGIYASNALEILKTNDWVVIHFAGVPDMWSMKPPLGIWLTAISFLIFGVNEFAIRFWSAFSAVILVLLVYFFGKKIRNNLTGLIAALILISIPDFLGFHGARTGDFDIIVTLCMTASIFFFYLYIKKQNKYFLIATGAFIAGITLTKQIVAIIPILIILIYLIYSKSFKKIGKKDFFYALITYLVLTLPWFILRFLRGKEFLIKMITRDIIGRSTTVIEEHYGGPFFYIQKIYENLSLPSLILLLIGIAYICYMSFRKTKNNKNHDKNKDFLFIIYILLILILFSIAKTKISWYLIPMYPIASIVIAISLNDIKKYFKIHTIVFVLIFLLLICSPVINSYTKSHFDWKTPEKDIADHFKKYLNSDKDVYTYEYDYYPYSLFFYINKETKGNVFIFNDTSKMNEKKEDLALISNLEIKNRLKKENFIEIDNYENYFLLKKV